jgi:hypothetical protein
MKTAVSWIVAPCILVEIYRRFKGACCLHLQGSNLKMEAASTSETSVNFNQTECFNIPEDSHLRMNPVCVVSSLIAGSAGLTENFRRFLHSLQSDAEILLYHVATIFCSHIPSGSSSVIIARHILAVDTAS